MAKVHVIGAGPAGSIAAISAARAGHKVLLSEEHKRPGMPVNCSGLFSKEGLDSLRDVINYKKFAINDLWGANIHFAGEPLVIRSKKVMGYACDRAEFDAELASNAELEGVRVRYGERVKSDGFKYNNIIGADGPNSIIARNFQMGSIPRIVSTLRAVVDYPTEDRHVVDIFLSKTGFPGFFGWIIPHNEETVELGVGVELPNDVQKAWKHLLNVSKVKKYLSKPPKSIAAIIPIDIRAKTTMRVGKQNILLVGDAAGQVKATTGGGVVFGGLCSKLAGKYATHPLRYDIEWRARYGPDLSLHRMIREYLNWMSDAQLKAFGRRLRRMRFDEYLSRNGSMDKPSRMIKPQIILHILKNIAGED